MSNTVLRLSLSDLTRELAGGAFRPGAPNDFAAYLDAPPHVLFANINRGNHHYTVLFDCVAAEFEITFGDTSWVMYGYSGELEC